MTWRVPGMATSSSQDSRIPLLNMALRAGGREEGREGGKENRGSPLVRGGMWAGRLNSTPGCGPQLTLRLACHRLSPRFPSPFRRRQKQGGGPRMGRRGKGGGKGGGKTGF